MIGIWGCDPCENLAFVGLKYDQARLFHYNPVKYDLGKGEVEKVDFVGLLQLKLFQPNS